MTLEELWRDSIIKHKWKSFSLFEGTDDYVQCDIITEQ